MKQTRLTNQFPAISTKLPLGTQKLLTRLEGTLTRNKQMRILVQIEVDQRAEFFLICMERLLRYTQIKRLLVLTSASCQSVLMHTWQAAISREDEHLLINHFPTRYSLTLPLGRERVYMTTVRELQLLQIEHRKQFSRTFDMIVAYDFPVFLSPVWKQVLEKQQVSSLIAFCERPTQEVIQWFDGILIEQRENEEGTAHTGFTQWPTAL